jgi:hypothetical protein
MAEKRALVISQTRGSKRAPLIDSSQGCHRAAGLPLGNPRGRERTTAIARKRRECCQTSIRAKRIATVENKANKNAGATFSICARKVIYIKFDKSAWNVEALKLEAA